MKFHEDDPFSCKEAEERLVFRVEFQYNVKRLRNMRRLALEGSVRDEDQADADDKKRGVSS